MPVAQQGCISTGKTKPCCNSSPNSFLQLSTIANRDNLRSVPGACSPVLQPGIVLVFRKKTTAAAQCHHLFPRCLSSFHRSSAVAASGSASPCCVEGSPFPPSSCNVLLSLSRHLGRDLHDAGGHVSPTKAGFSPSSCLHQAVPAR